MKRVAESIAEPTQRTFWAGSQASAAGRAPEFRQPGEPMAPGGIKLSDWRQPGGAAAVGASSRRWPVP